MQPTARGGTKCRGGCLTLATITAAQLTDPFQQIDRRVATKWRLLADRKIARLLLGFSPARLVQVTVKTEIFSSEALGQENDLISVPGTESRAESECGGSSVRQVSMRSKFSASLSAALVRKSASSIIYVSVEGSHGFRQG